MEEEKIRYGLKNDYMFRAAMQSNEKVLRGLVCALLDLRMDEIKECVIENPIILGEDIDDKTCILDVKILLNNDKRLNIEMQTTDYGNWQDRSLFYLCRAFNELGKGKDYTDLKTTIHIGILDFTLFPDAPEFYSEYLLMNTKTHKIFNRKFALRVLDLTQLEKVSEEEKETDLYYWAKLFQSRSWEEITMLAEKNEAIREAASTIKKLNADERIKMQCEAREQLEHDMASAYHHGVDVGEKRGMKLGEERGMKLGEERGRKAGIRALERTNELYRRLAEQNRMEDIVRATADAAYREELYKEFNL